jgi:hypothetical protein
VFTPPTLRQRADLCDALTDARIAENTGKQYRFTDQLLTAAANYFTFVLTETNDGLLPHVRFLGRLYGGVFYAPLGQRFASSGSVAPTVDRAFRHSNPLSEPQTLALLECGPATLRNSTLFPEGENIALVRLLLNPVALWDLADLIGHALPRVWLTILEDHGRRLAAAHKIDLTPKPAAARKSQLVAAFATDKNGPRILPVRFAGPDGAVAQMDLAKRAYGDPNTGFLLRLHRKDECRVELEMVPAPHQTVALTAQFATSEERVFTIVVPELARDTPPEDAPPMAFSAPCDSLQPGAFPFRDAAAGTVNNTTLLIVRSVG